MIRTTVGLMSQGWGKDPFLPPSLWRQIQCADNICYVNFTCGKVWKRPSIAQG